MSFPVGIKKIQYIDPKKKIYTPRTTYLSDLASLTNTGPPNEKNQLLINNNLQLHYTTYQNPRYMFLQRLHKDMILKINSVILL